MDKPREEFTALMARVRAGDRLALEHLCQYYGQHIRRIVRRKLNDRLRSQFDSNDFTQDVWASFVAVPPERFVFETPEELVGYLARLAANKVTDAFRDHLDTAKRDLNRLQPLDNTSPEELNTREPTPSQVAVADERWTLLLRGLTEPQRQIAELLRQGCTYKEVAERAGIHVKAVQRLVKNLTERLEA